MIAKLFKLTAVLQVLHYTIYSQPICKNNLNCTCFIRNNEIHWSVAIDEPLQRNIHPDTIYMQTKREFSHGTFWENSTNCVRTTHNDKVAITCAIKRPPKKMQYRVQLVADDEPILISELQPVNGFFCYPDHNIRHLRPLGSTRNSVNISWSLNQWDVVNKFIAETVVQVLTIDNEIDRELEIVLSSNEKQFYTIEQLDSCKRYTICVINIFTAKAEKMACAKVYTQCSGEQHLENMDITVHPQNNNRNALLIISCLMIGLIIIVLSIYFIYRQRARFERTLSMISLCGDNRLETTDLLHRPFTITNTADDDGLLLRPHVA